MNKVGRTSGIDEADELREETAGALDASLSSTLIRGIEILQCFSSTDKALSNAEIARRVGLKRPTVSRLCKTLAHLGYLSKSRKGGFRLTPELLSLIYPVLAAMPWRYEVQGPMRNLAELCSGNASIGVLSGDSFVHVQTAGIPPGWPHIPDIGQTGPLYRSALGWSLLSMLHGQEFSNKIDELRVRHSDEYADFEDTVNAAVQRCRKDGFCVSYGDWRPNLIAAGAPLGKTEEGQYVAIACALPRYSVMSDYFETDLGPRLAEAAESIRLSGTFVLPPSDD